jgi:hypothetical protein
MAKAPPWAGDKPDSPRLETVDPGQQLLQLDLERERGRVAAERQERLRKAPPPLDQPPPFDGVVRLHETPRPDGLAVDVSIGSYALKRLSPFRNRWPEVHKFDERVTRLEQKQADLNAELLGLQEQLVQAEAADHEALAQWVATQVGERPLPTAPSVEQRINERTAERDALTAAQQNVLDEKHAFVEKHRGRLVREAGKTRERALAKLHETIAAVEAARAELVEARSVRRWAEHYPAEEATSDDIQVSMLAGGLQNPVRQTLGTNALIPFSAVVGALQADADTLLAGIPGRDDGEPDIRDALWLQTDEGIAAQNRERERLREAAEQRNHRQSGWWK